MDDVWLLAASFMSSPVYLAVLGRSIATGTRLLEVAAIRSSLLSEIGISGPDRTFAEHGHLLAM
jgi:hypothetical protein